MPVKKEKKKQPRTDKRKNIGKVAEVLANNPQATVREIAQETDMSIGAVHSSKVEVEQSWTKDETIAYIVGKSKDRIKRSQRIFDRYLDEVEAKEVLERADISLTKDIIKDDMARVTVFGWELTDEEGWLKDLTNAKMLELEQAIKHLLN